MMALTVKKLLRVAANEIGYHEKNSDANLDLKTAPNDGFGNHTKYARDLYGAGYYNGDKCGFDYCDVFVDWCFWMASGKDKKKAEDVECQTGLYGAGVGYSARYYKAQNRFFTSNPKPGDQIFFGSNDHTGIVEKVSGDTIVTIEGNTANGMVERKSYNIHSGWIMGYGRPKYDSETEDESEMRYEKLKDITEKAYRPTIDKLIKKGIISGKGGSGDNLIVDLGEDAVRILVYLDRQGIFG